MSDVKSCANLQSNHDLKPTQMDKECFYHTFIIIHAILGPKNERQTDNLRDTHKL